MQSKLRPAGAAVMAAVQLALVGCASYRRVEPAASPTAGTPVRVSLTDAASVANVATVGARAQSLQGRLIGTDPTGLSMSVTEVTRFSGVDEPVAVDSFHLAAADVTKLEVRQLSKPRSIALAVGAVAIAFVVRSSLGAIHDVGGRGTGGQTGSK